MSRARTHIAGNQVYKIAHSGSASCHALLREFRSKGLDFVPEPIALDAATETLSYLPGQCFGPSDWRPPFAWEDGVLRTLGLLLRRCHDVSEDFLARNPGLKWYPFAEVFQTPEVICHNDLGPWNVPIGPAGNIGIIDWEMAAPGFRIWDVAHVAWNWIPLFAESDRVLAGTSSAWNWKARLTALVNGYGGTWTHEAIFEAVLNRQSRVLELVHLAQQTGDWLLENWAAVPIEPIERDVEFTMALLEELRG